MALHAAGTSARTAVQEVRLRTGRCSVPALPRVRRRRRASNRGNAQAGVQSRELGARRRQPSAATTRTLCTVSGIVSDGSKGGRVMRTPVLDPALVSALKKLKLGHIAETLPDRLVLADKQGLSFESLLLLVLSDEIARRESTSSRSAYPRHRSPLGGALIDIDAGRALVGRKPRLTVHRA